MKQLSFPKKTRAEKAMLELRLNWRVGWCGEKRGRGAEALRKPVVFRKWLESGLFAGRGGKGV
jgi:hypothetical protein